jgi:hypothetical protein
MRNDNDLLPLLEPWSGSAAIRAFYSPATDHI